MFDLATLALEDKELAGGELKMIPVESVSCGSKFDLSATARMGSNSLSIAFEFSTSVFADSTIESYADAFGMILESLRNVETQVINISTITPVRKHAMEKEWNDTEVSTVPWKSKRMHHLVAERAEKTPDATAIVFGDEVVTYAELIRRARCVAAALPESVTYGSCVGMLLDRSLGGIVAMLGIWERGAVYVPLSTQAPKDRLDYIARETGMTACIVKEAGCAHPSTVPAYVLSELVAHGTSVLKLNPAVRTLPMTATYEDVAYIIYTSGSTGVPKGVMVHHGGLVNAIYGESG
eukprot:PhF_6_TR26241/c1_g2_i2/m.37507